MQNADTSISGDTHAMEASWLVVSEQNFFRGEGRELFLADSCFHFCFFLSPSSVSTAWSLKWGSFIFPPPASLNSKWAGNNHQEEEEKVLWSPVYKEQKLKYPPDLSPLSMQCYYAGGCDVRIQNYGYVSSSSSFFVPKLFFEAC